MTEFTAEFIEEQRKIIRNGTMTVLQMKGNNEIDLHINMMYRRAKQEHCEKYYPEALDHIERLQARVQELEQERRWIPVSERMPEGNELIFVYAPPITYPQIATYNHMNKCFTRGNVTHWQPIPQPPKEGE